ncbi:hypothetical protein HPC49_03785 [Pyxidicoccus fallax]|uniref:SMP-30/Gluconolactonase/LRE-like region domain-containing protein n=1 Tax=Pyxidicoccus fallax TaxID=394095 RepID=A0A848L7S6_9BACT|nr:SMP-30/gluconolactonase/LRE family protein [Pyxidicoccus fallax]NMO14607.1 hypothetical protein [Pyxidicoccus fallax]NPC77371.1 hypothetical protein [Pyxidicoccus fallax]
MPSRNRLRRVLWGAVALIGLVLLVVAVLGGFTPAGRGVGGPCQATSGMRALCAMNKPEDLLRLGDSEWVLAGNMGNDEWKQGGFYAIRTRDKAFHAITPDLSRPAAPPYRDCPGAPDRASLSAHGIALRSGPDGAHALYVVNHGGRESIEVFDVRVSDRGPELSWSGCVVLPPEHAANSVATLPDGGLVITIPHHPSATSKGKVLRWAPGGEWAEVPGTRFSYDNGILVSPDGAWLYVAEYMGRRLHKVPLGGKEGDARSVELGFRPDNLRFAPDGAILATGHPVSLPRLGLCFTLGCGIPTEVARVDATTLQATTLYERESDITFSAGTSAIVVDDELWIGSFQSRALLIVPFTALKAPVLPGAPSNR